LRYTNEIDIDAFVLMHMYALISIMGNAVKKPHNF